PGEEFHDVEDAETYKKMLARDERRFRVADQDGDSMATREELTAFLHPEEFPHMRDIVVAETLEDLDKNKDGYIQVDEYIDFYDGFRERGREKPFFFFLQERTRASQRVPVGLRGQRHGQNPRIPPKMQFRPVECDHLIYQTDTQREDGRLSKAEILGNWNMFVGSQATNYGEDLTRHHDEL
uniref:EF-hand domain-containing protein n=1 Tax=Myotis lucifugus TaxID=59463 RepID=G1QF75_MYOLU